MAAPTLGVFLRQLRQRLSAETLATCSDVELVERFRASRDDAVFQVMLDRHGAMVFQVCRRALSSQDDVEDAFQATFLTLIRRGHTIRRKSSLGSWLHGVAHRIALNLRRQAGRRRRREQRAAPVAIAPTDDITWRELRDILDAELRQLPEMNRTALVLCYLEGRTQDESAAQLGVSKSTVRRHLERGRELLGRRLARRGIALAAVLSARLLSESSLGAQLSRGLLLRTAESMRNVAGKNADAIGIFPTKITALSDGVIKTMYYAKYKTVVGMLACCLALAVGVYQVSPRLVSAQDAKPSAKAPSPGNPEIEPIDPNLVFDPGVQKQLRLSENQIRQLAEARDKGTAATTTQSRRMSEIDQRIKNLEEEIAKLRQERDIASNSVHKAQVDQVKASIPKVLSRDAVEQLRQITIQRMRLSDVLLDARIRDRLDLNDEQIKRIQELADRGFRSRLGLATSFNVLMPQNSNTLLLSSIYNPTISTFHLYPPNTEAYFLLDRFDAQRDPHQGEMLKVLTPKQREALERISGQSFEKPK